MSGFWQGQAITSVIGSSLLGRCGLWRWPASISLSHFVDCFFGVEIGIFGLNRKPFISAIDVYST
jgi:hypothetical protein